MMNPVRDFPEERNYMQRCIQLARKGQVSPNPMVGSLLVHGHHILSESYHKEFGGPHAEVNCIQSLKEKHLLKKSTLYVSLEPCSHFGKTPPCTDLIIESKIPEVVIGCQDPAEHVNGQGIEKLRAAGIKVRISTLEKECKEVNKRFFTYQKYKRPYIILKWAESEDGYLGKKNERTYLSNPYTNTLTHQWRSMEDAILIGYNTLITDNPQLNTRNVIGKNPIRCVISNQDIFEEKLHFFDSSQKTILFNPVRNETKGLTDWVRVDPDVPNILSEMYHRKIMSLIVEGGAKTLESFIRLNLWDEARIIRTNKILNEGVSAPKLKSGKRKKTYPILSDTIFIYSNSEFF